MKILKLSQFFTYLLMILVSCEARRILIFTSNLNRIPTIHEFLSTYNFDREGPNIEVHNVITWQEID